MDVNLLDWCAGAWGVLSAAMQKGPIHLTVKEPIIRYLLLFLRCLLIISRVVCFSSSES
jgi:hypothetical protein